MACATEENVQEYKYVRLGVLILTMLLPGCVLRTAFPETQKLAPLLVYIWLVITTMYPTSHNAMTPC